LSLFLTVSAPTPIYTLSLHDALPISGLPDVVRALSEPLSKVDKVTIVSTGGDGAAGAYKLTGDVTKIVAQVPALFEALSGMQMSDLLSKVRLIGDKAPRPEQPPLPAPKKQ